MELGAIIVHRSYGENLATNCSASGPSGQYGRAASVADWSLLGPSLYERTVDDLKRATSLISVVTLVKEGKGVESFIRNTVFKDLAVNYARSGVERILVVDLIDYVEFSLADLLSSHVEKQACRTELIYRQEEQGITVLDAGHFVGHSGSPNPSGLAPHAFQYECSGYCQRFMTPGDYRELVRAALQGQAKIRPDGVESMPGVWIARGAKLAPSARLLAPCYVGANTKIAHGALITGNASIEQQSHIDCGTFVSDSTVLPGTHVGPGLHVYQSIVAGTQLLHLGRNTGIELSTAGLLAYTKSRFSGKSAIELNLLGA